MGRSSFCEASFGKRKGIAPQRGYGCAGHSAGQVVGAEAGETSGRETDPLRVEGWGRGHI